MRRLFVIAAALGLMWALQAAHGSAQGTAGMALAAIGFVVLASFTVGDLLSSVGLPRITGYIVSGIILGPELIGVLSKPVVAKMGVFNTLALGLIALSAGLEIDLGAMRRVARTMIAMTAAKVVLLCIIVGGGLYLTHLYILPLPVPNNDHALLLVALIAVLGIGTSPSITLAMVNETKSRGRLTDLTLGLAVLKDVVVIIALAVTIAIGHNAIAPETSVGIAPVVLEMAEQLGLSIALGGAVGVLLILYVKYVHRELLLGALVAVLITAEVCTYFELELLLVLISAGFVVRNASDQEHHLVPALQRISLPVFVVFFTTAGAKVDLGATTSVLPFAVGAAVARAFVYYLAARFGVWVGREGSAVRKNAWFALLPQAGVTLGLVLLAAHEVPELHEQIMRIGLAIVAINLLVGPVLLGIALGRAGEIPGRSRLATAPTMPVPIDAIAALESSLAQAARKLPVLFDARLDSARAQFTSGLESWVAHVIEDVVAPLADRGKLAAVRVISEHEQHENTARAVRVLLDTASADPSVGLEDELRTAHFEARALAEALPERFKVVTERRLLRLAARDGVFTWASKLLTLLAVVIRLKPKRRVPVRLAARAASEERLAKELANVVPAWFEARGDMLRELARLVDAESDAATVKQTVVRRAAQFTERVTSDLRAATAAVVEEFHLHLATLGGPSSPPSQLRLFELEKRVVQTLASLDEIAGRGREVLRARMTTLHADTLYAYVAAALDEETLGMVSRPLATVAQELIPIIRDARERLPEGDAWGALDSDDDPLAVLAERLDQALDERSAAQLRGLQMKYYHATQESKLLARLATNLEGVPAKLVVVDRHAAVPGTLLSLEPARRLEEELIEDFAPDLIAAIRPLGDLVSSLDARVNRALYVASRGIAAARASEARGSRIELAREPVTAARKLLDSLLEELTTVGESTSEAALRVINETRNRVAVALGKTSPESARAHPSRQRRRWWSPLVDRMSRRAARLRQRGETFVRALLRRPEVREWIIRTGNERLDTVSMREYVTHHHARTEELRLPAAYSELVLPVPIDDIRLATARRSELATLVDVLQPGKSEDFTSVLIFGERGSGRTSLVNILGHRLARRRVIRLDARYHVRLGGPLAAMAAELHVALDPVELANALRRTSPSIVLLDDLERFLRPSAAGIEDLDRFLRLVRATASYTHWVVTAQTATIELVDPFVHVSETFGRRIHLQPVDAEELDRLIQTRIQVSGFGIRCIDGSRRTRLRPKEAHRRYVRTLTTIARGNLRRALLLHARSIVPDGENGLVARDPRAPGLPFLRHLGGGPLAALSLVTRCVELTIDDLAEGLGVPVSDIDRFMLPLHGAGLIESVAGRSTLAVPPHLVDVVCTALAELGLRPGGGV